MVRLSTFVWLVALILLSACSSSIGSQVSSGDKSVISPSELYRLTYISSSEAKAKLLANINSGQELLEIYSSVNGKGVDSNQSSNLEGMTVGEPILITSLTNLKSVNELNATKESLRTKIKQEYEQTLKSADEDTINQIKHLLSRVSKGSEVQQLEDYAALSAQLAANRAFAGNGDFYIVPVYKADETYLFHFVFPAWSVGTEWQMIALQDEQLNGKSKVSATFQELYNGEKLASLGGMSSGYIKMSDIHLLKSDNIGKNIINGLDYQLSSKQNTLSFSINSNSNAIEIEPTLVWNEVTQ
jgi:hypothetical protein